MISGIADFINLSRPVMARFFKGSFWAFIGTILSQGLMLLSTIIITRNIGDLKFGEYTAVHNVIILFSQFSGLGLGLTATKYVSELLQRNKEATGPLLGSQYKLAIIASVITIVLFLIAAPTIATNVLHASQLLYYLQLGSVTLLLNSINSLQVGILSGLEEFKSVALINLVRGMAFIICVILFVPNSLIFGVIYALIISALLSCVISQLIINSSLKDIGISISYKKINKDFGFVKNFSIPALLSSSIIPIVVLISNTIITNESNGFSELGIFNAANQWKQIIVFLPGVIGTSIMPIMSSLNATNDQSSIRKIIFLSLLISGLFAVSIAAILFLFSNSIMGFYGKEFENRGVVLQLVALYSFLLAVESPVAQLIATFNNMWTGFAMNISWGIILIASVLVLVKVSDAANALGLAYIAAYLLHGVWTFVYVINKLKRI
ncbi:MAG: oligosaccharide flippase family protein [Bellilinea sp.]